MCSCVCVCVRVCHIVCVCVCVCVFLTVCLVFSILCIFYIYTYIHICMYMYMYMYIYIYIYTKRKKTWLVGEFEGRWSTRRQGGEWDTDARDGDRTGVSEWLPSQPRGNVGAVRMDTSACRCRSDMLRSTGAR